jgi:putative cell wall-binding protein
VAEGQDVGALEVTLRTLPEGNVAVFSRLDAPTDEVHVDLEIRAQANSHTFRGLDPDVQPDPVFDPSVGYDRTTNPIGFVELEHGEKDASSLFIGKAYEFRELTHVYPNGQKSWLKELVREESAYSLSQQGDYVSLKLFLSGGETSCERYFVVSPRPILDESLGSTGLGVFAQPRFRWVDATGPLMKGPWSIHPFTKDGYIRSLQQLRSPAVIGEALETASPFMRDIAYSGLYSLWRIRDENGLWRTHWTSTWVESETGIVAPYVDSRHNEMISVWLLDFARTMDVSPELEADLNAMALPYADFLLTRAARGEVLRAGVGYFFPPYFDDVNRPNSFATLNHSLGAMRYLLLTHQATGRAKYLVTALAIRDAVRETTPGWITESGDLWYRLKGTGEFLDQDYRTLTLMDLHFGQQLLQDIMGRGEPAFDTLIQSKITFLNNSAMASVAVADSMDREPVAMWGAGDENGSDSRAPHRDAGWWAAPEHAESIELAEYGVEASPGVLEAAQPVSELPELGGTPVSGTLGSDEDSSALYTLNIPEGRIARVRLYGPAASDFDLRLYAPGGGPGATEPVAARTTLLYPETLVYAAPPDGGGDYVLEVRAKWGEGDFTMSREVFVQTHSELSSAFSEESSPITGLLDPLYDRRDTYRISLQEGDHFYATVSASTHNRIGLRLLAPDAERVTEAASLGPAYADRVAFTVPPGGAGGYYLDVHCISGGGTYRVDFVTRTLEENEQLPGVGLSEDEAVAGWVHWGQRPYETYSIDLHAGETLRVALLRATLDAPVDAHLISPGATSLSESAVASARGWGREVGLSYTVPEGGEGLYTVAVHASWGSSTYTLNAARGGTTGAIGGDNRFATAVEAAKRAYPAGLPPDGERTVVIATGRNWPDALGGAALAGALDAPILLVGRDVVPEVTRAEISRLGARKAIILGGTAAVGDSVQAALGSLLGSENVRRVAGGSRYETANEVARLVIELRGDHYDGTAFVATGGGFADALAAAPLAAAQSRPVFLVHPESGLSSETRFAMGEVEKVFILGGTSAVSGVTETELVARYGSEGVSRLSGRNRYDTAASIAAHAVANEGHIWNRTGITSGQRFPDALAGGVVQGKANSVMLLARGDRVESTTRDLLTAKRPYIATLTFYGGEDAISTSVRDAFLKAIE